MNAVIIFNDPTWAIDHITNDYLEFVIILIFENQICRSNLIDQVQFKLLGNRNHLANQRSGFIAPWNHTSHFGLL